MTSCELWTFDLGACISGTVSTAFWGLAGLVPWWVWLALLLIALGAVWKFSGWPGLVAAAGLIGVAFGRYSARRPPPAVKPREPERRRSRTVLRDVGEPVEDWWKRVTSNDRPD